MTNTTDDTGPVNGNADMIKEIVDRAKHLGSFRIIGTWPDNSELPDDFSIDIKDAFYWKEDLWVLDDNRAWVNYGRFKDTVEEMDCLRPAYAIKGSWPNSDPLPRDHREKNIGLVWRHRIWVSDGLGNWVDTAPVGDMFKYVDLEKAQLSFNPIYEWVDLPPISLGESIGGVKPVVEEPTPEPIEIPKEPISIKRISVPEKIPQAEPSIEDRVDVGAMARELLERKTEVKRLKRKRIMDRCVFWFVVLGVIAALGYFAYGLVLANYETGRYSDERQCKVVTDNLTITGKRTYSYPYKSLFGFRLIDESKVSEQTVINVTGDKMSIIGLAGKRWWGYRIGQGERGIQILKPADTYTITTDKGLAVVTHKGFCQAVGKQSQEADPKAVDQAIID